MKKRVFTIPVLGPIPGGAPLLVGEDFILESPTPLQWQVLEEALFNHREYLKAEEGNDATGIIAAPLVAFMDEITSRSSIQGNRQNAKYATIAALVGISSSGRKASDEALDTSSTIGFMESLMRVFEPEVTVPSNSKIRIVGIGRAALSNFYTRVPSTHYESTKDTYLQVNERDTEASQEYTPVMMAHFRLLQDEAERSSSFARYGRSRNSSPIHALNEMSSFASRITSLHEDRKRLVRGLKAAKARLAVASANDNLEDHDGLGQLTAGFSTEAKGARAETQKDIETLLNNFPGDDHRTMFDYNAHERLLRMENYGLGISSASFAQIPGLTRALEEKLQPYYSPEKQESEEHYYEVFSFMGVLSLSKFVEMADMDWALKCTNTIERMEWVYEKMWLHKRLLQDASEEVSEELRDCGEECTDLW